MGQLDKEFAAATTANKTAHRSAPATATTEAHSYAFFDALTQLTLQQKRQRQQRQRSANNV